MKYLVTIFILYTQLLFSQSFNIAGEIIPPINGFLFYNFDETSGYNNKNDTIKITNGIFSIKLENKKLDFPIPIMFFIFNKNSLINTPKYYLIEPKSQVIKIIDGDVITIKNAGLKNQENKYNTFFLKNKNEIEQFSKDSKLIDTNNQNEIKNLTTRRNYLFSKKDTLLLKFSEKNPNSFYVLKDLSINLSFFGYKEIYDETFKNLSSKLKNTEWGINIENKLFEMKNFSKGFVFPIKKINDNVLVFNKKYTLVDFWFSYCQPCLREIPIYKELYQGYKDKGFNIISISTDRKKDVENWKKVIKINNILWENFLDENGNISKKYNINKFPTNFLLDFEGKIIKRDITQEELKKILENNLK